MRQSIIQAMATAILSCRNSLNHPFDHEPLVPRNPNSRPRRHSYAATTAPRRIKRSPTASHQSRTLVISPAANTNLVMGQVKILKRGETLSAFRNKESNSRRTDRDGKKRPVLVDLIVASTNRIGPEPETVQKQIGSFQGVEIVVSVDYAGACCSFSPPPSSLPIPCFLGKD